jgi:hypothetical protein
MYFKGFVSLILTAWLFAAAGHAQDPTTARTVVENPDGTYTVIEYPLDKETVVNLVPVVKDSTSKGTATVLRTADGTKVIVNVNDLAANSPDIYAYAVDANGRTSFLGPVVKHD